MSAETDDPRLNDEQFRTVRGATGTVTLVGCVHDHPASKHRVRHVIRERNPDVLALEVPRLAVPLFEQYAQDEREPPVFGGEMSAAIQAASTDCTVGIDGPTLDFAVNLLGRLFDERASVSTTKSAVSGLLNATKTAVACRVGGLLAARTSGRIELDSPTVYECDWHDSPREQAVNERQHLRRARSLLDNFTLPKAERVLTATREEFMADQLATLADEGDVVAVVGESHLDPVSDRLTDTV